MKDNKLSIVATDLDIVFYDEISDLKVVEEGNTTTSANVLFDILRKIPQGTEINFTLKSENKLSLKSKNSDFNLLCLPSSNFPTFDDKFESEKIEKVKQDWFTKEMIDNFFKQARLSYAEGLASLYTYERQIPEIAETKIQGLKKFYGVNTKEGLLNILARHRTSTDITLPVLENFLLLKASLLNI